MHRRAHVRNVYWCTVQNKPFDIGLPVVTQGYDRKPLVLRDSLLFFNYSDSNLPLLYFKLLFTCLGRNSSPCVISRFETSFASIMTLPADSVRTVRDGN